MIGKDGQSSKRKRRQERAKKGSNWPNRETSIAVDSRKARVAQAIVVQDAKLKVPAKTPSKRRRKRRP